MLRWTKLCQHCRCVSAGNALDQAPIVLLDSDPVVHCCCDCGGMIFGCGSEEEDDDARKREVMRKMITKQSVKS